METEASLSPDNAQDEQVSKRERIVVVGLGMVGIAFIEKLINLNDDKRYVITTFGEETLFAYNRVALTEYFEHRNVEKLYINPPSWYAAQRPEDFEYHLGEAVVSISHNDHLATTDKGRQIRYDKCVLATGSTASVPQFLTPEVLASTKGVFVYRNISDLNAIMTYAEKDEVKHAVVVGGGLLGLEAAKAVYDLETISTVSIVNRQAFPLSRQLDAEAGEMVLNKITALGVQVLTRSYPTGHTIANSTDGSDDQVFTGLCLNDGTTHYADMVIYAIGIVPRDEIAHSSGIECHSRRGIIVDDQLKTSADDVYAIGECANWGGNTYGLIAPGVEMADILAFNFTQTKSHSSRKMNAPDLSTKLKLMGVDVASFGDFFADKTRALSVPDKLESNPTDNSQKTRKHPRNLDGPVKCLVYKDPFSSTYKKYIFTADGKYLIGGMMIGDVADYVKLVAIVKKKKALEVAPSELIVGSKSSNADDAQDLDDDAQVCSCHNVLKADIIRSVKDGCLTIADLKKKTKAGTGCGGCVPLVTKIFNFEMQKAGHQLSNHLCPHFAMARADLFSVIRVKQMRDFNEVMQAAGVKKDSVGCEICKPAVASILSSLYNENIMNPVHHQNQDTNDRFLANMQRNGTFSVIPRIAAGEVTPDGLMAIGRTAKKYGLYTKITGGQRVDMFGARKDDLPDIWEELNNAGFESGHAYGKSLRTVKSCVGTTWCRYGVGDSVGLAVQLENRYRGVRSPHKFKGGVSGCVRECAEAQGKDFGVIATDKGWNIFVGGNGGAQPRHAELLAKDVPPSKVISIIDRFLAYYIMTADKLQRTARWIEAMDGGINKLRKVILDDELGICDELEALMKNLINTYEDEWAAVVKDPAKRSQFKQFVNTDEKLPQSEIITQRGQNRPADWPKEYPSVKFTPDEISTPSQDWKWIKVTTTGVMGTATTRTSTSSVAVKYGNTQLAVYYVPGKGYYTTQQMCPHRRAFVLDHGIIGESDKGDIYVSCPLHKRNFSLSSGTCLNDAEYQILTFETRESPEPERVGDIEILLPPVEELDSILATEKWLVRQAESEKLGLSAAAVFGAEAQAKVEIVGPVGDAQMGPSEGTRNEGGGCGTSCASALEW